MLLAVEPRAVALKLCGLPLNPRTTVLKLGTRAIPHLAPAQRGRVVAHRRGSVLLAGLLVPLSRLAITPLASSAAPVRDAHC